MTQYYLNRIKYKGGSPTLAASSGIINNAVLNGHSFYDDDYNPTPPEIDYSQEYFAVEAVNGGNFTLQFGHLYGNPANVSFEYSIDKVSWLSGITSSTYNFSSKVYLRSTGRWAPSTGAYWNFNIQQDYKVSGNIMSLTHGSNFINQTSIRNDYEFIGTFEGSTHLCDAQNLVLPATTLKNFCYYSLFNGCTSLAFAPKSLPATTLQYACYTNMFRNTIISKAPALIALTLPNNCYEGLFYNCRYLNEITCLATNISARRCLDKWVYDVALAIGSTGTFIKNPSMSSWPSGTSGIPSGWAVQDYVG